MVMDREEKQPATYIVSNRKNGTLYVGVTSALWKRIHDHKNGTFDGFTRKYGLHNLVWYEHHHDMTAAIRREKLLKKWLRQWKLDLIDRFNPTWADLHEVIDPVATLADAVEPGQKMAPPLARRVTGVGGGSD
jgi:putative endonuclease